MKFTKYFVYNVTAACSPYILRTDEMENNFCLLEVVQKGVIRAVAGPNYPQWASSPLRRIAASAAKNVRTGLMPGLNGPHRGPGPVRIFALLPCTTCSLLDPFLDTHY